MPPRSKVAALPKKVKEWLDTALVETNFSGYELLAEELAARGYSIGKSALHRYGQDFAERLSALKFATEQAQAIVAASPDKAGAVNEALMRLIQERMFQVLVNDGDSIDIPKFARAASEIIKASVVQKKWQTELEERTEAAAQKVEKIARKGGLSAETVEAIRREILGVAK